MRFCIETYGCTANFGNSEDAARALSALGHQPSSLEEADVVIVNTCAVTERTERKMLHRLRLLQGERLVLAGCLSAALPESVRLIGCRRQMGLLNGSVAAEIADLFSQGSSAGHEGVPDGQAPRPFRPSVADSPNLCAVVNIAEGCNGGCSFCIVKKARGRLVSRRPEEIVKDVRRLVGAGIAEVQLAAQDTAAYGQDIGTSLPELLEEVDRVPGRFMVRVGMMNPDRLHPILGELVARFKSPRIYKVLHLPVQSGSASILESMGRRYSAGDILEMVRAFRSFYPDLYLITDAIAGFPGEEEADFRQTMDLIKALQPDKVNVTRFSRRPGTAAARLYDMPERIKKDRSRELTRLWMEIAAARNRQYVGRVLKALVTERGRCGSMKARAANYAGIVVGGAPPLGSLCEISIVGSNPFYLNGLLH